MLHLLYYGIWLGDRLQSLNLAAVNRGVKTKLKRVFLYFICAILTKAHPGCYIETSRNCVIISLLFNTKLGMCHHSCKDPGMVIVTNILL